MEPFYLDNNVLNVVNQQLIYKINPVTWEISRSFYLESLDKEIITLSSVHFWESVHYLIKWWVRWRIVHSLMKICNLTSFTLWFKKIFPNIYNKTLIKMRVSVTIIQLDGYIFPSCFTLLQRTSRKGEGGGGHHRAEQSFTHMDNNLDAMRRGENTACDPWLSAASRFHLKWIQFVF